jgi:hypothetical protein
VSGAISRWNAIPPREQCQKAAIHFGDGERHTAAASLLPTSHPTYQPSARIVRDRGPDHMLDSDRGAVPSAAPTACTPAIPHGTRAVATEVPFLAYPAWDVAEDLGVLFGLLRDRNGREVPYEPTALTQRTAALLARYNHMLARYVISYMPAEADSYLQLQKR